MNSPVKTQELVATDDHPAPVSMMEVISRAASDPRTDVDKLARLLELGERMKAREAKAAFLSAMVAMKPKLPVIDRKGKIEVREKDSAGKRTGALVQATPYAKWEDIDAAITPILNEHGFVLTFRSGVGTDGKITVTGVLGHNEGHTEENTIALPHDSTGSKNAVQAVGSSVSYGMRYTAMMLLNIRTKGLDDDGRIGGSVNITEAQASTIRDALAERKINVPSFCEYMGVPSVPEIAAKDYDRAMQAINSRQKPKAEARPK